jgi:hypothetical protein
VPTANGLSATGGTYGEHVLSRPFANLASFVDARVDDDPVGSMRAERRRLPGADSQSMVRLRFTLVGTASWFWGIDDFKLLGMLPSPAAPRLTSIKAVPEGLRVEWSGPAGPYQLQHRTNMTEGAWLDLGLPLGATQTSVVLPRNGASGFFRIQLAR